MKIKTILIKLSFLFIFVFLQCMNVPSAMQNSVQIQNFAFSPQSITVNKGQTVTWDNKDTVTHTVTDLGGTFDSGNILSGGTYSRTFSTAGTFNYKCSIHTTMTGTVIVQ